MAVLEILGIIVALGILVLMSLAPTLVDLNDRHPARVEARAKVPTAARPVSVCSVSMRPASVRPVHHH